MRPKDLTYKLAAFWPLQGGQDGVRAVYAFRLHDGKTSKWLLSFKWQTWLQQILPP